jgi:hypothetical protein
MTADRSADAAAREQAIKAIATEFWARLDSGSDEEDWAIAESRAEVMISALESVGLEIRERRSEPVVISCYPETGLFSDCPYCSGYAERQSDVEWICSRCEKSFQLEARATGDATELDR